MRVSITNDDIQVDVDTDDPYNPDVMNDLINRARECFTTTLAQLGTRDPA